MGFATSVGQSNYIGVARGLANATTLVGIQSIPRWPAIPPQLKINAISTLKFKGVPFVIKCQACLVSVARRVV